MIIHIVFVFPSLEVICYIYFLHMMNHPSIAWINPTGIYWINISGSFVMIFDSISYNYIEKFCIYVHHGKILLLCLSGFGIKIIFGIKVWPWKCSLTWTFKNTLRKIIISCFVSVGKIWLQSHLVLGFSLLGDVLSLIQSFFSLWSVLVFYIFTFQYW
jgi:hypothetical protein